MSSAPDNPWLDQGLRKWSEQPSSPAASTPSFCGRSIALTLMAVFYIAVIRDGRDAADPTRSGRGRAVDREDDHAQRQRPRWRECRLCSSRERAAR